MGILYMILLGLVIGAVFVTTAGVHRMIPEHWLAQAELSEGGCLLRLFYTCCTMEVAGRCLETLFEDAVAGRLGMIIEGTSKQPATPDQLWVSSLVSVARAEAASAFERE